MVADLKDNTILYHGSYCSVRSPDISKCSKYKDFGQGFYLTTDADQARAFSKISLGHAIEKGGVSISQNYGIVSSFVYHAITDMRIKIFPEADSKWLHCIVGHRRKFTFKEEVLACQDYDIIGGKIANDATNLTIATYMLGAYGVIGSKEADELCISFLIPQRLKNQYCFRTIKSLESFCFLKEEHVWM